MTDILGARHDEARVIAQHRASYVIEDLSGPRNAAVSGRMVHLAQSSSDLPVVGDRVTLRPGSHDPAVITGINERTSLLLRKAAGPQVTDQPLAANVDTVFVVVALDKPLNLRSMERYVTLSWSGGATPVVVLTKADTVADPLDVLQEVERNFPGLEVYAVDSLRGELPFGEDLLLPGRTIALLGASGAGKSTLLNRIASTAQPTGEVRKDGKGRHTTVARHMFVLPSGVALIDTPGLRELGLWGEEGDADTSFDDIASLAASCRFNDCQHDSEPGCAVLAAIAAGELDPQRLVAFHKLKRELRALEIRKDIHAQRQQKRRFKQLNSEARARTRHR